MTGAQGIGKSSGKQNGDASFPSPLLQGVRTPRGSWPCGGGEGFSGKAVGSGLGRKGWVSGGVWKGWKLGEV